MTGAPEIQIGAFGLILVNDLAAAAGAASIPGPYTDRGDDGWFTYVPIAQGNYVTGTPDQFDSNTYVQYQFDSSAKRILDEGRQVAIMVENRSASFGFNIQWGFRLLSQVRGTR